MMDIHKTYYNNHFMMYMSQIIMLSNLNLYSAVCQLYCNKAGRKKMQEGSICLDSLLVYYNTSSKLMNSSKP